MLRHARAAVPWLLVGTCAALVVVLMGAVRAEPLVLWPLQGIAVGLVAAASAWCVDEPAAAVVDPTPRSLAWRTTARGIGVGLVTAVWLGAVWWARGSLFGEAPVVALQGVGAALAATAWATWRRSCGEARPGNRAAMAALPVISAWALVRPFDGYVPVFPYAQGGSEFGSWGGSAILWGTSCIAALGVLGLALDESRRFRSQPGRGVTVRPRGRVDAHGASRASRRTHGLG